VDIHISGLTGTFPDDYEKEICTVLLVLEVAATPKRGGSGRWLKALGTRQRLKAL